MHALNRTRTRTRTRREEKKRDSNSSILESHATEEKITQSENLMAEKAVEDANVRTKVKDTIQQLLTEKNKARNGDEESKEEILLLSKLLSQLDESEKDCTSKPNDSAVEITELDSVISESETNEVAECGSVGQSSRDSKIEEMVKEIKEVKRQNSLTHWLLSIMIILTATWQFSEVTFLLNVKDKLSRPFRSVGNLLTDALTIGHAISPKGSEKKEGTAVEHPSIHALHIPELPQIDLPVLGHTGAEHTNSQ